MPSEQQVTRAARLLESAHTSLLEAQPTSVDYLEGVAQVRHALCIVGDLLCQSDGHHLNPRLAGMAERLCTDAGLNSSLVAGPAVFLVKYIVRKHGLSALRRMEEKHPWVIPDELKQGEKASTCTCMCRCICTFKAHNSSLSSRQTCPNSRKSSYFRVYFLTNF